MKNFNALLFCAGILINNYNGHSPKIEFEIRAYSTRIRSIEEVYSLFLKNLWTFFNRIPPSTPKTIHVFIKNISVFIKFIHAFEEDIDAFVKSVNEIVVFIYALMESIRVFVNNVDAFIEFTDVFVKYADVFGENVNELLIFIYEPIKNIEASDVFTYVFKGFEDSRDIDSASVNKDSLSKTVNPGYV